MDFGDISYKFIIDEEGQLSHSEINFEVNMSMDVSGMSATYKYSFDGEIRFSDLGTTVITPPADAESYI